MIWFLSFSGKKRRGKNGPCAHGLVKSRIGHSACLSRCRMVLQKCTETCVGILPEIAWQCNCLSQILFSQVSAEVSRNGSNLLWLFCMDSAIQKCKFSLICISIASDLLCFLIQKYWKYLSKALLKCSGRNVRDLNASRSRCEVSRLGVCWIASFQCKDANVKPETKAITSWHSKAFWIFTSFKKGRFCVLSVCFMELITCF